MAYRVCAHTSNTLRSLTTFDPPQPWQRSSSEIKRRLHTGHLNQILQNVLCLSPHQSVRDKITKNSPLMISPWPPQASHRDWYCWTNPGPRRWIWTWEKSCRLQWKRRAFSTITCTHTVNLHWPCKQNCYSTFVSKSTGFTDLQFRIMLQDHCI